MFTVTPILRRSTNETLHFEDVRLQSTNYTIFEQFVQCTWLINQFSAELSGYLKTEDRKSLFQSKKTQNQLLQALHRQIAWVMKLINNEDYLHFYHALVYIKNTLRLSRTQSYSNRVSLTLIKNELDDLEPIHEDIQSDTWSRDIGLISISSILCFMGALLATPYITIPAILACFYLMITMLVDYTKCGTREAEKTRSAYQDLYDHLCSIRDIYKQVDKNILSPLIDNVLNNPSLIQSSSLTLMNSFYLNFVTDGPKTDESSFAPIRL